MQSVPAQDIVFLRALKNDIKKPLDKPNFHKQTFHQAMKGNQNIPNRQVTSNNMTGKPLPFSHRSCSNSREHRNHSRHRSPNKFSQNNSKPYYGNSNFKPPSRNGSPYPRPNFQTNSIILDHNHLTIIGMEIAHDDCILEMDFIMSGITLIPC